MASLMTEEIDGYRVFKDDRHELGRGTFAVVWRATHVRTGEQVAVKRVKPGDNTAEGREFTRKYVEFEIEALRTINHKNVVKLYHTKKKDGFVYLFIEFCERGNLGDFVKDITLSELVSLSFMYDLANAVCCLHEHVPPIIHRDIKPANLLITEDVTMPAGYLLKLTDFGVARRVQSTAGLKATVCGSPDWMAPEIRPDAHGDIHYDKEADIFSMALVHLSLLDHIAGQILRALTEAGLSLGDWISRQPKPVKLPNIVRSGDSRYKIVLKGFILQMLCPEPSYRCSIQLVCDTIQHHYDHAVVAAAESAAGSAAAAAAASVDAVTPVTPDHAVVAAAESSAGSAAAAAAASVCAVTPVTPASVLKVKKLAQITLPVRSAAVLSFGHMDDFLVVFTDCPSDIYYYQYKSHGFQLVWKETVPADQKDNCIKYTSPTGDIFLQRYIKKVCVYDRQLNFTKKLHSPGRMICLIAGGRQAVVDNRASARAAVRLSVVSASDLRDVHHHLDVPPAGHYSRDDLLLACGQEDGRVAVVVWGKPFIDVYNNSGRHECRTELPGDAKRPECSSSHILVPLWEQPRICVLGWSGQLLHTLDHAQLHLQSDDLGYAVSAVHEGRFSFSVVAKGEGQVHTYQIV